MGNVATGTGLTNVGDEFYNNGTGTFVFEPDAAGGHTSTVNDSVYSSGANAVLTVDPSVTTLIINAPVVSTNNAVVNSSATSVTVGPGSGTENGYLVQSGLILAGSGATVSLTPNTTYLLNSTTGPLSIGQGVTVEGNGSTLNAQADNQNVVNFTTGAVNVTLNNLTIENGSIGLDLYYYNQSGGVTANLNNVTITGNSSTGFYDSSYYGYANAVNLTNCTISNNNNTGYSGNAGGIYNSSGTLSLTNCTISGNGNTTNPSTAGGIYNSGTISLDPATTITGNTGYRAGGIYNTGTILGPVNSSHVHGNTETYTDMTNAGADFYNTGTATFVYKPDGEANNTLTISQPIYSSGAGAVITIDPSIQTLNVNGDIRNYNSATFNSSATTVNVNAPMQINSGVFNSAATVVNVAAGTGTENGYLVEGGVALAGSGATVNLASGAVYNFDGTTGGLSIGQSLTVAGNGATLNAQSTGLNVVSLANGATTVTLNNLTVENGSEGVYVYYYNPSIGVTLNLNGVTLTGNTNTGLYNSNYYGYVNTVNLTNCTISNNDLTSSYSTGGGIYNTNGALSLTNCNITGNGNVTYAPTAGGVYNSGTLTLDSATTITANIGSSAGGIYNNGTIIGPVNSSQVHGNTVTSTDPTSSGTDFYNSGTATFVYKPDGEANNTLTLSHSIYSNGAGAVITVDPSIQTLNIDSNIRSTSGATFNSSAATVNINSPMQTSGGIFNSAATTVNVAAGSGTENGYLAEGGVAVSGSGGTVNLTAGATYNFDGTTGGLSIGQSLTLAGHGAILNGQGDGINLVNLAAGGNSVTLNNLTVENGAYGIDTYYYNPSTGVTLNLNNVTITGNIDTGLYDVNYY